MLKALRKTAWTLRIALPKVAVGWMFALLTIDFNRVAIFEMGVAAVVVTTLLSIHYFLAPFQVVIGRIADCYPVLGYRRSPYLLGGSVLASLLFLALPKVTFAMGAGSVSGMAAAVLLFILFGLCMAVIADSYHSMIAEVTDKKSRPTVIAVVWIVMILSTILSAVVMNKVRPEFSAEAMQRLYNLTPLIVFVSVMIGIVGVEKRLAPAELRVAKERARSLAPPGNPLVSAVRLINGNQQARRFFIFISVSIFAIFLQESVIEVFGAEVFGLGIKETTRFQPIWGGGILLGMIVMGAVSGFAKIPKRVSTMIGCVGAAAGCAALGLIALFKLEELLVPTLFFFGFCAGIFNVGALALMMDMTVEGATGMYMGLWGVAQAAGMGLSAVVSGALHTGLVASGLLPAEIAYWTIFSLEAAFLLTATYVLYGVRFDQFQTLAARVQSKPHGGRKDKDDAFTGAIGASSA